MDTWLSIVIKEFQAECQRRDDHLWAAHREGRHAGLSGRHFLEAVQTKPGKNSIVVVAKRLVGDASVIYLQSLLNSLT